MVDFTKFIPEGVVPPEVFKLSRQIDTIKSELENGIELDASTLATTLDAALGILETDLSALVPPIPTLPSTNLQSELQSLMALGANTPEGIAKLSSLKSKFGGSLTSGGFDLDTITSAGTTSMASRIDGIVGQIPGFELPTGGASELIESGQLQSLLDAASNADLSSLTDSLNPISDAIPNFDLPDGATEAIQKAQSVVLPTTSAIAEKISDFSIDETALDDNTGLAGDVIAKAVEAAPKDYAFPNPEINLVFPDKLQDLSGELDSVVGSLETEIAGLDIPSADLSDINKQLAVVKRQVLPAGVPLEAPTLSANLQTELDTLKTQLLNSVPTKESGLMSQFDNVKTQLA